MNGRIATRLPQNRDRSANSLGRANPTLALVVDHELEVLSHVPVPTGNSTLTPQDTLDGTRANRIVVMIPIVRYKAHRIMTRTKRKPSKPSLVVVDLRPRHVPNQKGTAPLNFDPTTLQSQQHVVLVCKTNLGVAQDLYDRPFHNPPRTDSTPIEDMHETVAKTSTNSAPKAITPNMSMAPIQGLQFKKKFQHRQGF